MSWAAWNHQLCHIRPRFRGEPPQNREQDESLERCLVELRRMQHTALEQYAPGYVGLLAPEFAIDEIANTAETETQWHNWCHKIRHLPHRHAALAPEEPHRDENANEPAVKRHAAFPHLEQVQRVFEHVVPPVDEGIANPTADDDAEHPIEDQIVDLVRLEGRMSRLAAPLRQPPRDKKSNDVH